jgi:hypothetical protein
LLRSSFPKSSPRSRRRLRLPPRAASQVASSEESRAGNWAACSAASWEESVTRQHRLRPLPSFTKGPTAWEAKCRHRA